MDKAKTGNDKQKEKIQVLKDRCPNFPFVLCSLPCFFFCSSCPILKTLKDSEGQLKGSKASQTLLLNVLSTVHGCLRLNY